ncbi:MAG: hypothetical protein JSV17_02365 [Candidatus Aminicenantes bacterium]|nr:MAG: hypothetical protein JSV17_02365 [Candidatus Aminicenantes bacterium]
MRSVKTLLLIILYIPISCSLIGLLAYQMRSPSPVSGAYPFLDVFWHYANPFNSTYSSVHLLTLTLSIAFLFFMALSVSTSKPVISIFHIRIFLLVLIVLITIIVMIFVVTGPQFTTPQDIISLFLYVDVHLILLMLLTYLPIFRKLKPASKRTEKIEQEVKS